MGMELMYERMPEKKWYVILDDDTFVIAPSLKAFLGHLDYKEPYYIGHAVGDYRARFAHGGSAIVISGAAMKQLFARRDIVKAAYIASLDEKWGDRLVAKTFQKVGIYLNERYSTYFSGEPPANSRITADRFCAPIISFHQLRKGAGMDSVATALKSVKEPVLANQMFKIFRDYSFKSLIKEPVQQGHDHVGPRGGAKTFKKVNSAATCRKKCESDSKCLAWTIDTGKKECYTSPWMVIGHGNGKKSEGTSGGVDPKKAESGINGRKVEALLKKCP